MKHYAMKYFDVTNFAKAVKQRRFVELGLDMRQAAKQIKTSAATLSRIENEKLPEINTALNVCHWLKIPITSFVKTRK